MSPERRSVKVGSLFMGGDWPVSIQTMWKSPLPLLETGAEPALGSLVAEIRRLESIGCQLLRFAVPDETQARALGILSGLSPLPLVADIHFDWRLALLCMDYPIAKIRINPGNIGARWKVREVAAKAREHGIALRIGVNSGSLPEDLRDAEDIAQACVTAAEREIGYFEELGFSDIVVSMKLNDPAEVERANRIFAARYPHPLHLGVTEAGPLISGVVRNTAAIVPLLKDHIGATLRVSLSDSMEAEVLAAREILACAGATARGVRIVSCPRCGRASFDTHDFLNRWSDRLYAIDLPLEIAVMGCVVNGPGEARRADLGITGAGDSVLIFRRGGIVARERMGLADQVFEEALNELINEERSKR
ncbi:4-hydroxy-3-methylbut-2-en-1-yl diphosphate synthase (flavodoxin) [bioreactor metagenome]|jgi:(E)-4-hydroxy-3-methylbut-2-enyl-diphosphate synthase|uniref:4-hydroxy-3-methylbut-2-en-1-yl diphosphate synthase (flavodoxin) n=2 Tax=root TaxID=1 RepID=A0A652ZYQ2_9SPIR|nr:(E)-4-hydroxy-3-methylbut-2-enyl-diphosphate synthase [Spirochaetales bacterium]NLX45772.1 (E)-4-hydroxy-3-methylbut-2-enyl-diphosphate synthase [Treponema sp.]VBB40916.1 4-hydroxy-3-methylbut-2-en-1-yl diphosphate synthase [uncultured Spirochaetota bacterium]